MSIFKRATCAAACASALIAGVHASAQAACRWQLFPTINPYATGNQLVGVAGTSASDVWEVGASFRKTTSHGYALHWNGSGWTSYQQADPHHHGGQLSSVAAVAPNDVWSVGVEYLATGYAQPQATIAHWNGSGFTTVAAPSVAGASTFLYGVAAFSAADLWAVGGAQPASGFQNSYLIHWDGSAWSIAPSPNVPNMSTNLTALSGTSSSDVWAVGDAFGNPSSQYATLAEHWNGTAWQIVPTANVSGHSGRLNAVVALAPNDAWAAGEYANGSKRVPLIEHWDGTAWSIVTSPDPNGDSVFLLGAAALAPNDVWAVGEITTGPTTVATLTLRWNGKVWKVVKSANVRGKPVSLLNGAAAIPGAGLWAVGGDANAKAVIDTVTERYGCAEEDTE